MGPGQAWHMVPTGAPVVIWREVPIESKALGQQVPAVLGLFHRNKKNNDCAVDPLLPNRLENLQKENNKPEVLKLPPKV